MRVLIDIPEDDLASLDALARRNGRSRAAEVRQAVQAHLRSRSGQDWITRGFGYWQGRDEAGDAIDAPRRKRC